jgi:hypothetical protein
MEVYDKRMPLGPDGQKVPVASTPVAELAKADYSWDALRVASANWQEPVIVRGLFSDTRAVHLWPQPGGLASLANFEVSLDPMRLLPEPALTGLVSRFRFRWCKTQRAARTTGSTAEGTSPRQAKTWTR